MNWILPQGTIRKPTFQSRHHQQPGGIANQTVASLFCLTGCTPSAFQAQSSVAPRRIGPRIPHTANTDTLHPSTTMAGHSPPASHAVLGVRQHNHISVADAPERGTLACTYPPLAHNQPHTVHAGGSNSINIWGRGGEVHCNILSPSLGASNLSPQLGGCCRLLIPCQCRHEVAASSACGVLLLGPLGDVPLREAPVLRPELLELVHSLIVRLNQPWVAADAADAAASHRGSEFVNCRAHTGF